MATTVKDVRAAFERFCRAADFTLTDGERFELQEGSTTYGYAWRVFVKRPGSSGLHRGAVDNFLGSTRAEAEARLHALADGIEVARNYCEARHGFIDEHFKVIKVNG